MSGGARGSRARTGYSHAARSAGTAARRLEREAVPAGKASRERQVGWSASEAPPLYVAGWGANRLASEATATRL